jgi:hypothetical protein
MSIIIMLQQSSFKMVFYLKKKYIRWFIVAFKCTQTTRNSSSVDFSIDSFQLQNNRKVALQKLYMYFPCLCPSTFLFFSLYSCGHLRYSKRKTWSVIGTVIECEKKTLFTRYYRWVQCVVVNACPHRSCEKLLVKPRCAYSDDCSGRTCRSGITSVPVQYGRPWTHRTSAGLYVGP